MIPDPTQLLLSMVHQVDHSMNLRNLLRLILLVEGIGMALLHIPDLGESLPISF